MSKKALVALSVVCCAANVVAQPTNNQLNNKIIKLTARVVELETKAAAADIEAPTVVRDAPASTSGGQETITITFADNVGLFQVWPYDNGQDYIRALFSGEKTKTIEYEKTPYFGVDTKIEAYAIDLAGNATATTSTITSNASINPGTYILDTSLVAEISGQGCGLNSYGPFTATAVSIGVTGEYRNGCDLYDANESPETVACINVYINWETNLPYNSNPLAGSVSAGINSDTASSFSKDQRNSSSGSYATYTNMTAMFSNTTPATVSLEMTLRCESDEYGTEVWGPYNMEGTLQE